MTPPIRFFPIIVACVALGASALAAGASRLQVTPFEKARFVPFDPKAPKGAAYALLSGDPAKGPSQMLMRYGRDGGGMHRHSSDYQAVVVQGIAKHWPEGSDPAQATPLSPGGYWSQPAGQLHADSCVVDECVIFVTWSGKMETVRKRELAVFEDGDRHAGYSERLPFALELLGKGSKTVGNAGRVGVAVVATTGDRRRCGDAGANCNGG